MGSLRKVWTELRSVHPIALLSAFTSIVPVALVRLDQDDLNVTLTMIVVPVVYFIATLVYRRLLGLKIMDFSIDNGSNFNDEISADPTAAQKIWLFLVSWAGAIFFGALFGFVVSYNTWKDNTSWLSDQPTDTEARVYFYIFSALVAVSYTHLTLPTTSRV